MPGIENKYFLLRAHAPNVHFMTFAPTGVGSGFALGVFRRRAATGSAGAAGAAGTAGPAVGPAFTGLVRGDRVRDVSALGTVNDLLADWDEALATLAELAKQQDDWHDLASLDVRCPVVGRMTGVAPASLTISG